MAMIPILNYPDIDGARYSRTSVAMSIVATQTTQNISTAIAPALAIQGWTKLSYKESLTPGKGWAGRAKPQVRTRGKYDPSAELGLYMEDYILVRRYLTTFGATRGKGAFEQSFQLTTTLYEQALQTTRWDIIGCRLKEASGGPEGNSDEPIEVSLTLDPMDILLDGSSVVYENTPFGQLGVVLTF